VGEEGRQTAQVQKNSRRGKIGVTPGKQQECLILGRKLLDGLGLGGWALHVADARAATGLPMQGICVLDTRLILLDKRIPRKKFRQTLLHEAAHALAGTIGHGRAWQKVALSIGCTQRNVSQAVVISQVAQEWARKQRKALRQGREPESFFPKRREPESSQSLRAFGPTFQKWFSGSL
jgi:hypothetical protein